MMKRRLWAVLLTALFLLILALPASAEEGGLTGDAPVGPANGDQGDPDFPDDPTTPVDPDPPTDPEPSGPDDPTPPPEDDPTPPPTDDPPSSDPGTSAPSSSDPGTSDPSSSEPGPDDPPSSEPGGDDPSSSEPDWTGGYDEPTYNGGGSAGGGTIATPKPRRPGATGGTILQSPSSGSPSTSPRPGASAQPGGSSDAASTEPNYFTFARVNQRNNSMSIVLFYSGAGCIGVGALGLVTLVVFIVRGRRNAGERDDIFEEIQQAEIRQPVRPRQAASRQPAQQAADQSFADGYGMEPQPTLHRPEPEVLSMPVNGNLYTEEFEVPRQAQPYGQPQEYEEEPYQQEAAPVAPVQAAMYTEEFVLPEEMAQPPAPQPRIIQEPAPRPVQPYRPAPQPRPAPPPQKPQGRDESFDTSELLREILYTEEDRPHGR